MNINKITFQGKDGSLHYVDDVAGIASILLSMPKKLLWKHTSNIEKLRNVYFAMLTEISKNCNTGYSKADLHNSLKPLLLNKLKDFKHCFKDGTFTNNTTDTLNYEGWLIVIEQLKVVANDIFNYSFKD